MCWENSVSHRGADAAAAKWSNFFKKTTWSVRPVPKITVLIWPLSSPPLLTMVSIHLATHFIISHYWRTGLLSRHLLVNSSNQPSLGIVVDGMNHFKGPVCNFCWHDSELEIHLYDFSYTKSNSLQPLSLVADTRRCSCNREDVRSSRNEINVAFAGFPNKGAMFAEQRWSHLLPARRVIPPLHSVLFNVLSCFEMAEGQRRA